MSRTLSAAVACLVVTAIAATPMTAFAADRDNSKASTKAESDTPATSVEQTLPWFRALPADQRSWVMLVAQAGVRSLVEWLRSGGTVAATQEISDEVFAAAPRALAQAITLTQTVQLVKVTIDVAEAEVPGFAEAGEREALLQAILRFSREVAFSAARVYARAAYLREIPALRRAGADAVFTGEGEVALAMTEFILRTMGASAEQIDRERDRSREELFGSPLAIEILLPPPGPPPIPVESPRPRPRPMRPPGRATHRRRTRSRRSPRRDPAPDPPQGRGQHGRPEHPVHPGDGPIAQDERRRR